MASGNFVYKTQHSTLGELLDVSMTFKDGDLEKVDIKYGDEVLIMSGEMFFAVMGVHAHSLYEKAAESEQNERLSA